MKVKLLTLIFLLFASIRIQAKIVIHPAWPGFTQSSGFKVNVEGQEAFVAHTDPFAFCSFDADQEVNVVIETHHDLKWVDIRPTSRVPLYRFDDHRIYLKVKPGLQLSIELNGENKYPLYLFVNPVETSVPPKEGKNVRYFESGKTYDAKQIDVKSGETLYLEAGTLIRGKLNLESVSHVKITGRGMIDGTRNEEWNLNRLIMMKNCTDITVDGVILFNSLQWTIQPAECKGISFNNIKILNWDTGSDGIDICSSENVTVINSFLRCNDDCVVIKSPGEWRYYPDPKPVAGNTQNVRVENSVFWNMAWGNALEIGFELRSDEIKNIVFRNCDVINCDRGAVFSIHNGDWANVHDILFENIRVENAQHKLIDLAVVLSQYSYDRPEDAAVRKGQYKNGAWDGVLYELPGQEKFHSQYRGQISNVTFKDIAVVDGKLPFSIINGYDQNHEIKNVQIINLTCNGKHIRNAQEGKIFLRNIENIAIK